MLFVCLYSLALFGGRKNKIIENQRLDLKKNKYQLNSQNAAPMALVKLRLAVWKRLRSHQLQCLRNVLRPQTFCKQLLWYQNLGAKISSQNRESKIMIVTITTYQFKLRWEVSGESISKGKITILMMKTLMLTTMMVLMILAIMTMMTTTMMMMEDQFH